jgi:hypothetical protein
MGDEAMYDMVDRWLSTTPADDEKALVLKEASADAIMKAASLSKMSAFNKLNRRLHKVIDKLTNSAVKEDLTKEVERLRAVRQEAEQLYGPMAREEKEAAPQNINFQLAFLTQVPTHINAEPPLQEAKGTIVHTDLQPLKEYP